MSCVALLALSAVLATFAIRELLVIRLEDQVDDALQQEVLEFRRLPTEGRDPDTGRSFTSLRALFDVFMERNVPSREEALLAFIDGRLYRTTMMRFPLRGVPAETMARWLALSRRQPMEGGHELGTSAFETGLGKGYARAVPVRLRAEGLPGAFVVAGLPVGEREEIRRLQSYAFAVTSGVLLIGSLAAWFVAGRVLGPIRLLTQTALAISESDLTRRIQARGKDELADMGRAFNAMLDRLEAAFRSQRGFVRDASHELRDPLTVSRGHLELIGGTPDEQRETIALVIDEIDRMARTVDELQLLAEAEHPDFLRPGSTDLGHFTHELAAKAGALAPREWNVETAAEGTLDGDRHRLTEAVLNLAHNAVQQTRPGDAIAIGTSRSSDEVRIWLRDSGPGVPLADHARIFRRFERGSSGSTAYRGSGLGLSIVKAIAEAHGGRVELDSRPGDGATFTIVVPANEEQRGDGQDPDR